MTNRNIDILNRFIDKYDELTDAHLVEGCAGASDPYEIETLNAVIAALLIITEEIK